MTGSLNLQCRVFRPVSPVQSTLIHQQPQNSLLQVQITSFRNLQILHRLLFSGASSTACQFALEAANFSWKGAFSTIWSGRIGQEPGTPAMLLWLDSLSQSPPSRWLVYPKDLQTIQRSLQPRQVHQLLNSRPGWSDLSIHQQQQQHHQHPLDLSKIYVWYGRSAVQSSSCASFDSAVGTTLIDRSIHVTLTVR